MKSAFLTFLVMSLLLGCDHKENDGGKTSSLTADSIAAIKPKPKNCQSVVKVDKLGKSDVYQESAKAIQVSITLDQDTSSTQLANECYYNNTVTVSATKKSGSRVFKRILLKDDLLYFIKSDMAVEQAILENVTYKPTFNSQKYITLAMQLVNPSSKKTVNYLVTMNYFGEIIKVK